MIKVFWKNKKVVVTGGNGFIGKNLVPILRELGSDVFVPDIKDFDLTTEEGMNKLFSSFKPEVIIHLAADVGGIAYMNSNPAKIYYNNIMMNTLLFEKSVLNNVKRLICMNTVNSYSRDAAVPLQESR